MWCTCVNQQNNLFYPLGIVCTNKKSSCTFKQTLDTSKQTIYEQRKKIKNSNDWKKKQPTH
jgi:hypothetical protein